eukprot:2220140-Rhodomonas_salina.1
MRLFPERAFAFAFTRVRVRVWAGQCAMLQHRRQVYLSICRRLSCKLTWLILCLCVCSFECTCPEGYTNAIADAAQCLDIDECTALNMTCRDLSEQCNTNSSSESACPICANSQGSFACACNAGFAVSSDSLTQAVRCEDVDECSGARGSTHGCHVSAARADSSCDRDRSLRQHSLTRLLFSDGKSGDCADVRECLTGAHNCDVSLRSCCSFQVSHVIDDVTMG